jgi:dynein heavy chain
VSRLFENKIMLRGGTCFDFLVDTKQRAFVPWTEIVPAYVYAFSSSLSLCLALSPVSSRLPPPSRSADPKLPYFQILVPTIDTVRYAHLLHLLLSVDRPVLFTGGTGVGKSVIVSDTLTRMSNDGKVLPIFVNFSAQTSAGRTKEMIEVKLEKRKTLLRPPVGKKAVLFVDDVNMPMREEYGAQPPIEFLRLYLDRSGLYDREKTDWSWKEVKVTPLQPLLVAWSVDRVADGAPV